MTRGQLMRFEGKEVVITTYGGNCYEGILFRAFLNSVWMEEGFHINTQTIKTCEVKK